MKLLILAAGYATRLYPLTKNTAKPLLAVAGRPMIEHVVATTEGIRDLDVVRVEVPGDLNRCVLHDEQISING